MPQPLLLSSVTVTAFLGVESNKYWQGQSLIEQNK